MRERTLDGKTGHQQKYTYDNEESYERLAASATKFLDHMETRDPQFIQELCKLDESRNITDYKALQSDPNWMSQDQNTINTHGESHPRKLYRHNWMDRQSVEDLSENLLDSFDVATEHLSTEERQIAARELTDIITAATKNEFAVLTKDGVRPDAVVYMELADRRINDIEEQLTEGLSNNDFIKVYEGLNTIRYTQENLDIIDGTHQYDEAYQVQYTDQQEASVSRTFVEQLEARSPQLVEDLRNLAETTKLTDREALQQRPEWVSPDAPITEWDRTTHYRHGDTPEWLTPESQEQAAIHMTEAFHNATSSTWPEERQALAKQLTAIITGPMSEQLQAATMQDLPVTEDYHERMQSSLDLVQSKIVEGLLTHNINLVHGAAHNMANIQENMLTLEMHMEQTNALRQEEETNSQRSLTEMLEHRPTMPEPQEKPQGLIKRIATLFHRNQESDNQASVNYSPQGRDTATYRETNLDHQEEKLNHFQMHGISARSEQRLMEFAQRFEEDSVTYKVITGERNLSYEPPAIRDEILENIVDDITKFDFPNLQDYHDIADDLTQTIVGPMLKLMPNDWQQIQDMQDHVEIARTNLDFLSSRFNKEHQLGQLNNAVDGMIRHIVEHQSKTN